MDQDRQKRPVLESSGDLKRSKGGKKRGISKWAVLILCLILLGGLYAVYQYTDLFAPDTAPQEDTSAAPEYTSTTLMDRNDADLQSITVKKAGGDTYTVNVNTVYDADGNPVTREDPGALPDYTIEGKPYFRLVQSAAASMATYGGTLKTVHTVEADAKDVAKYGLDKPQVTVTYKYADGTSEQLLFGNNVPMGIYHYISKVGDRNVYMVYSSVFTAYNRDLNSLHVVEMPTPPDPTQMKRVLIEQSGKETIELSAIESAATTLGINTMQMLQPIRYGAHSQRANDLLSGIAAITINGYAGHAEAPEELAGYGLDAPRIHILTSDGEGNSFEIRAGAQDSEITYVQIDDSGDIYTMDSALLSFLSNATVGKLADQFANLVDIKKVDAIKIDGDGTTYNIAITRQKITDSAGVEQEVAEYIFDGETTPEESFRKIYQDIIGTLVDKVSDNTHIEGDVVVRTAYALNTDPGEFVVEYLAYDKDYYAVRRDGLTLFLIKREKVDQMMTALRQYRDGTYTYK